MRTLLIDNYDSYTYNLFQVIAEVNGELPLVCYNDKITLEQIASMVEAGTVHSIVISPGPGTPSNPHDIGVCMDVLQQLPDVPILGICLGHQALALAHGAAVVAAPEPVHGRVSRLRHSGHELFKDIPSGEGFEVVRYHSLLVAEGSLPDCLQPVCWTAGGHSAVKLARDGDAVASCCTGALDAAAGGAAAAGTAAGEDGGEQQQQRPQQEQHHAQQDEQQQRPDGGVSLLMGLAHVSRPHYGVQFHPESVATRYGIALLRNFRDLAARHIRMRGGPAAAQLPPARHVDDVVGPPGRLPALAPWPPPAHQRGAPLRLAWVRLRGLLGRLPGGSQGLFEMLYGWAHDTFWLDSAASDRGRFSYMGGRGGPLWRKLQYKLPPPQPAQPQPQETGSPPTTQAPQLPDDRSSSDAAASAAAGALPHSERLSLAPDASHPLVPELPSSCPPAQPPRTQNCPGAHNLWHAAAAVVNPLVAATAAAAAAAADLESDAASSSSSGSSSCNAAAAPCCTPTSTTSFSTATTTNSSSSAAPTAPSLPHHHHRHHSLPPTTAPPPGFLTLETFDGHVSHHTAPSGLLAHLDSLLSTHRLLVEPHAAAQLPFNFWGGLVGYLGYELKAECGAANTHAAATPDAVLYLADRLVAVDHAEGEVFLLALYEEGGRGEGSGRGRGEECGEEQAMTWLRETQQRLEAAVEEAAAAVEGGGSGASSACAAGDEQLQLGLGPGRDSSQGVLPHSPASQSGCCCSKPRQESAAAEEAREGRQAGMQGTEAAAPRSPHGQGNAQSSHPEHPTTHHSSPSPCCTSSTRAGAASAAEAPAQRQPCSNHALGPSHQFSTETSTAPSQPAPPPLTDPALAPSPPNPAAQSSSPEAPGASHAGVPFVLAHGREAYLRNIGCCHAALHAGESYEVCLTTALLRAAAPDPAQLYRTLRRLNPAPYAAWLQCGPAGPTICCSSPERFLRGDRGGLLEARPIKGTAARVVGDSAADAAAAAELASSEKERAENLMIVDLLRNDLGRVCEIGSVHVPGLMDIESYATVHQMVSTVRGVRRDGMSVVDCIKAAFPGGSMTGAPKVRTMQIIDSLEGRARGVYSGCIGFLSLNDTFDLNIVIRTAVIEEHATKAPPASAGSPSRAAAASESTDAAPAAGPRSMTIGAGGAIVVQSQPDAEYEEMRLKASALLRAVGICEGGTAPVPVVAD